MLVIEAEKGTIHVIMLVAIFLISLYYRKLKNSTISRLPLLSLLLLTLTRGEMTTLGANKQELPCFMPTTQRWLCTFI